MLTTARLFGDAKRSATDPDRDRGAGLDASILGRDPETGEKAEYAFARVRDGCVGLLSHRAGQNIWVSADGYFVRQVDVGVAPTRVVLLRRPELRIDLRVPEEFEELDFVIRRLVAGGGRGKIGRTYEPETLGPIDLDVSVRRDEHELAVLSLGSLAVSEGMETDIELVLTAGQITRLRDILGRRRRGPGIFVTAPCPGALHCR